MKKNRCKAFTIAEMMVVLLIMSIAMAMVFPVITKSNKRDDSAAPKTVSADFPVGTIVAYNNSAPSDPHWHICDGTNGTPDLRGYFLRGLDTSGSIDPDGGTRSIGSIQASANMAHYHALYSDTRDQTGAWSYDRVRGFAYSVSGDSAVGWHGDKACSWGSAYYYKDGYGKFFDQVGRAVNSSTDISPYDQSEARPKNVALNYIMKIN